MLPSGSRPSSSQQARITLYWIKKRAPLANEPADVVGLFQAFEVQNDIL